MYKLHVCEFLTDNCIINIKIDQVKFYHHNPVTEMTGRGQEGKFEHECHHVHVKYTRSS